MSKEKADPNSPSEKLIDAAKELNLAEIERLLKLGADVNYVRYTDSNDWYRGNSHTALYTAVHTDFKGDETNYVNVVELLLKAGGDPKFKAVRGGWNHCTEYPLFSGVAYTLGKFKDEKEKIRFIEIFVKRGVDINQSERHERSKNWRGYRTHTCFVFQMMDGCGIPSRLRELAKLYETVDISKLNLEKTEQLKQEFQKQFPHFKKEKEANNNGMNPFDAQQQKKQKKDPEVSFIEALINFGTNPNSSRGEWFWQNYKNDDYMFGDRDYKKFQKFDESVREQRETILHRAIMNNLPSLVKLLLKKGAQADAKCKFTITVPIYPSEWPKQICQNKIKENNENIKSMEQSKRSAEQKLKGNELTPQQKQRLVGNLAYYEFQIFKAKRFSIEDECPHPTNQTREVTCLELAEKMKVSQSIIDMIKSAPIPEDKKK